MMDTEATAMMYGIARREADPVWDDLSATMQQTLFTVAKASYLGGLERAVMFVDRGTEVALDQKADPAISGILLMTGVGIRRLRDET